MQEKKRFMNENKFNKLQFKIDIFLKIAIEGSFMPPGSISIHVSPLIIPPPKLYFKIYLLLSIKFCLFFY